MGHTLQGGVEQHTGLVQLFTAGKRPAFKSPDEIYELATKTKFVAKNAMRREFEDGSIEFVPRAFTSIDPIRQAMTSGLVVARFSIEGEPPLFRPLKPGKYCLMLDFAPGGEIGATEGRWIGRVVELTRAVPRIADCFVAGIEVKEVLAFGEPGKPEPPGKPEVRLHALASGLDPSGRSVFANSGWVEYIVDWREFGSGCWTTKICIPGT